MGARSATDLAFHGYFTEAEKLLPRRRARDEDIWVRAYIAGARGRFASAMRLAVSVKDSKDRAIRVAAAITAGSALRQLGRHRAAQEHDRRALRLARTDSERAHALIGLAADAIGTGRAALCGRRLAEATALAARDDWRAQVRLDWVRTEHGLALGRPRAALHSARRALRRVRAEGARRHIAKSHLFLGVALQEAGDERAAARELNAALAGARAIGAEPIAAVARAMRARKVSRAAG